MTLTKDDLTSVSSMRAILEALEHRIKELEGQAHTHKRLFVKGDKHDERTDK